VSKAPDRGHFADVIHLMELAHLVDEELPAVRATVDRSEATAVAAQMELEEHQRWLKDHQELYAEAVKECQRRLKRQALIRACKETAWLPIRLLASACFALCHVAWAYPRRFRLRAKLQNRIDAIPLNGPRSPSKHHGGIATPRPKQTTSQLQLKLDSLSGQNRGARYHSTSNPEMGSNDDPATG